MQAQLSGGDSPLSVLTARGTPRYLLFDSLTYTRLPASLLFFLAASTDSTNLTINLAESNQLHTVVLYLFFWTR